MSINFGIMMAIVGGALGQLLMKSGLQRASFTDLTSVLYSIERYPIPSLLVLAGVACYVASMFIWVHTLKSHPLNQAIPYLSLSYVLVYLLATVWPGIEETMTIQKSIGVSLIMIGVWYTQRPSSASES